MLKQHEVSRARELAARRRQARARAGGDGRAGARRARRPRARQRPLPDELLGDEGLRRRRLSPRRRPGPDLPGGLRGGRRPDELDRGSALLPWLRRERPAAAGAAGTRPGEAACLRVRANRPRAVARDAGGRPDDRRADDLHEGWFDAFPEAADATPLLNTVRAIKTEQEVERMRLANDIAAGAMEALQR